MASRVVTVTEFKAKCLSLLSEVASEEGTITVTKRGQPFVTVNPVKKNRYKSSKEILTGKIHISDQQLRAARSSLWNVERLMEKWDL